MNATVAIGQQSADDQLRPFHLHRVSHYDPSRLFPYLLDNCVHLTDTWRKHDASKSRAERGVFATFEMPGLADVSSSMHGCRRRGLASRLVRARSYERLCSRQRVCIVLPRGAALCEHRRQAGRWLNGNRNA